MAISFTWAAVRAFRMARHHLVDAGSPNLISICRDACGIQAQLMSAAKIALWARRHSTTQAQIHSALMKSRSLVRTSLMRQTLHVIPATDFFVYVNALKQSRMQALMRIMSNYFGITHKEVDALNTMIVKALRNGPKTQSELVEAIKPSLGKKLLLYKKKTWGIQLFRSALVKGLICYGPESGKETTLVRVDHWLPKRREISEQEAKRTLLRHYVRAYGPATPKDFARWAGFPAAEANEVWDSFDEPLIEVSVEGTRTWLLREDARELTRSEFHSPVLRLLPAFDSFLLGHIVKEHLVGRKHYKKVYRNQGWISPVVLLDGRVIGIWSHKLQNNRASLEVNFFHTVSTAIRKKVEQEVSKLAEFLGTSWKVKYLH